MLLILTNSQDATADYLTAVLKQSGVAFLRFDTDTVTSRCSISYLPGRPAITFNDRCLEPSEISHLWYRRPERLKDERFDNSPEGAYALHEWAEALEGFFAHIPIAKWMNHPSRNAAASHKLEQITVACSVGFKVPNTLVTQDKAALREFFGRHKRLVVVKPMASGYVERSPEEMDSQIYTNRVLDHHLDDLDELPNCPTLFQQFIQKQADVRITVVHTDIHAVELVAKDEDGSQRCDIRRNNMSDVSYRAITLPPEVKASITRMMEHYRLRFAAIDMVIAVTGEWYFLEINPNGQWAWLDLSGGLNIAASFVRSFSEKKEP